LRAWKANVLPLAKGLRLLQEGSLPPLSVVITFDDGFYDFVKCAVPLLAKFGFPSTLYLTTHYASYRMPIFNLLMRYLLWKSGKTSFEWPECGIATVPIRTFQQRDAVVSSLMRWCQDRQVDTNGKDALGRRIATSLGFDYQDILDKRLFQIMTEQEVARLASHGVDIQLHTHRHRTPRDRDLFLREIADNRARIKEMTGTNPTHFCYPSGDWDLVFLPWLREAGIESATTCQAALATRQSNPLLLPRFLDGQQVSIADFESWLCGIH
jgi:hypothetical protein